MSHQVGSISFREWVTFCEHGQLKGWQPHFQPTAAKSLVCSSHIAQLRAQSLHCNKSWRPQLRDQFLCLSAWDRFFPQLQRRDWHDVAKMQRWWNVLQLSKPASGSEWMLEIPKRNGGNGFLKQTCRTNLFSAVRHILRTWAAERLAARFPSHCG